MLLNCADIAVLTSKYNNLPPFISEMNLGCKTDPTLAMNLGGMALQFLDLTQENEIMNLIILLFFFIYWKVVSSWGV